MDASSVALVVAGIAVAAALVACVLLARQRPKAVRASQARHPAATPPIAVTMMRDGRDAHWRVELRSTAPPTGIDILSYRAVAGAEWESEPIVEPIELQPGGWAMLPSPIAGRAPSYDVVLGWTEHRADGDRTGSATLVVTESGPVVPVAPGPQRGWIVAALVVGLGLLGAGFVVIDQLLDDDTDDQVATTPPPTGAAPVPTTAAATVTTTAPTAPSTAPSTTPSTTAPSTSAPSTEVTTSTAASTTTSTTIETTTTTSGTTVPGPAVQAVGRIEDCRFGADCLVVGFSITGFESAPDEYVCEFADGERVTFGFVGDGAETACSARSADPSITIEVAGVRSNTVTPDALT